LGKAFREEADSYTACDAALRIHGVPHRHEELTRRLGQPTEVHRHGDLASALSGRLWPNDIWLLDSPLSSEQPIGSHIAWLSNFLAEHEKYILGLLEAGVRMDVYCRYRSNRHMGGFEIEPENLTMISRLRLPLGVSIMFAEADSELDSEFNVKGAS
jgi:hypothetical protein